MMSSVISQSYNAYCLRHGFFESVEHFVNRAATRELTVLFNKGIPQCLETMGLWKAAWTPSLLCCRSSVDKAAIVELKCLGK